MLSSLIVALAEPHTKSERPADELPVLVDISTSITAQQGDKLLSRALELGRALNVPIRLVPFGADALAVPSVSSYADLRTTWQKLDTGSTNIQGALAHEAAHGSRAALFLSDGYETVGNALRSHSDFASLRVFPLTELGPEESQDITISQLYAPLTAKAQSSVDVKVTLTNALPSAAAGQLVITHGEKQIFSRSVTLDSSRDSTFTADSDPAAEGISPIVATFSWRDQRGAHSITRSTWLSGETRDKVLLLSGTPDDSRYLSQMLQNQRYQLRSLAAPLSANDIKHPSDYRSIILNNVPHAALPGAFADALPEFVRAGGGLIMVGGNKSFGLGGYIGTMVEPILPVKLVPPYKEKKRLNVAVQLVIDKSRSMAAEERLEFAKAAAKEVVTSLQDDDYIGVIGFDEVPFIALPMSPVAQVRYSAAERISRLYPTNKTNLYPALDEARRGLQRINAGRKHTVILTDGKIPDASSEYVSLVRQMRVLGITASTVLIGSDADDGFLAQLAESGGGSFYKTDDPSNLPRIFLSDVKVASGEQTLKENPDLPVERGPSGIQSTSIDSFPTLRGFVETLPRDTAETELVISENDKMYPLLASMTAGKGRSIAFTSDANGRWSSNWARWSQMQPFWVDLLESLHPKKAQTDTSISFDVRSWIEGGELIVDLSLFGSAPQGPVTGELRTPRDQTKSIDLTPLAPGHYQAHVAQPMAGRYEATFTVNDVQLPKVAWSIDGEAFGERPHYKPNQAFLERLASLTGGKLNPKISDLKGMLKTATDTKSYAPLALLAALLLFFAEIIARETLVKRRARD
jgi:uncharacterized membrane protein